MINEPMVLTEDGFQQAWLRAVRLQASSQWEINNLVVQLRRRGRQPKHDHV